jgi:predicted dehydrogenase
LTTTFNWAIVGPGGIAHRFAEALIGVEGAALRYVQGRDLARAKAFAAKHVRCGVGSSPPEATTALDDVLQSNEVDAIYIATPHAFHAEAIRRCLSAKKAVLCEKSMVTDAATARTLFELARTQNTFLMEAVWTRFLPIYAVVAQWLRTGEIGQLRAMHSTFCFNAPYDPTSRVFDPAQAGGALLDIGIYNLTVTRWVLQMLNGKCPELMALDARAKLGPTGVDHSLAATLHFPDAVTSQFYCSVESQGENAFHIIGERGTITIHPYFWAATKATLRRAGKEVLTIEKTWRLNGFEGEIEETMRASRRGEIESAIVSPRDTIDTLTWMDRIRAEIGLRYPFDA